MDYIGNKCPVCQKYFHADDDIVVCPECGTPHHRGCYEQAGHCCNEHLHAQGYDYNTSQDAGQVKEKACPKCGRMNVPTDFFCASCGAPLMPDNTSQYNQNANGQGFPFGTGENGVPFLDPLGGVPGDLDLGDGVTAGEAAKYVKQNTPYFIRIFANIRNFNKSRFNLAAALFPGGYMLYRKMYREGALFASLQLVLYIVLTYLYLAYTSLFLEVSKLSENASNINETMTKYTQFIQEHSMTELMIVYMPSLIYMVFLAMSIVIGICFNRMYFKHCKKQIAAIKSSAAENENPETLLQTKGGVNLQIAASVFTAYMLVMFLPDIIAMFQR